MAVQRGVEKGMKEISSTLHSCCWASLGVASAFAQKRFLGWDKEQHRFSMCKDEWISHHSHPN